MLKITRHTIGHRIFFIENYLNCSHKELSKYINCSYTTISKWYNGRNMPDKDNALKLISLYKLCSEGIEKSEIIRSLSKNSKIKSVPSKLLTIKLSYGDNRDPYIHTIDLDNIKGIDISLQGG